MGSTEISSIGKIFASQSNAGKNISGAQDEDLKIQFADLMNQMTAQAGSELFSQGNSSRFELQTKAKDGNDFAAYSYKETNIADRKQDTPAVDTAKTVERLDSYEKDVKDVLKEELGVTDEQITEAMETLGLTTVDLMNPNQLAALVAELTGQEVSDLLCNSEFMNVMQEVNLLNTQLLEELGITKEQLRQICEELTAGFDETLEGMTDENQNTDVTGAAQQVEQTQESETLVQTQPDTETVQTPETLSEAENAQTTGTETVQTTSKQTEVENGSKPLAEKLPTEEEKKTEDTDTLQTDETVLEEPEINEPETAKEQNTGKENRQSQNQQGQTHSQAVSANAQTDSSVAVPQSTATNGFSSQLDVQNIMRQIVEYSRVTLGANQTTMEMELNPANLGKLFVEITSKNGVVSAHIEAQNAVVKEALEAQVAELRQNMNQAGVKVDAVEVTVGNHEFERNLEQNAKQEQQMAEQQEKAAKRTRSINLGELDELTGLMSEEESLVAQMMAEQGNTVDFTA